MKSNLLVTALDQILAQWQQQQVPIASLLQAGLDRRQIAQAIAHLPWQPPQEMLDFYQWRNGLRPDRASNPEFFPGGYFLSLEEALAEYDALTEMAKVVAQEAGIAPALIWDGHWFPLFTDIAGDHYVLLCQKAVTATSPVSFVDREDPGGAFAVYDSLTAMMQTVAVCYETGAYHFNQEGVLQEDAEQVQRLVRHHNPETVRQMTADVSRAGTAAALVEALKQGDSRIQADAARSLALLKDETMVAPLVRLLGEADAGVRGLAVDVLAALKTTQAAKALGIVLRQDSQAFVRSAAAQALGKIKDKGSVPALAAALDDPDVTVRLKAIWALGELKATPAVARLITALSDPLASVRGGAAKSLGQIRNREAVIPLMTALQDPSAEVRQLSAWALGQLRDVRATTALAALQHDRDATVRAIAQKSLDTLGKK